ncbi:MAG TPA: hypothetical protein VFO05_05835, partial [Candidatus Limnocylindrales bacterium]|nr:hypothetical protein [Candidatus Limnocylindrales bacterium]
MPDATPATPSTPTTPAPSAAPAAPPDAGTPALGRHPARTPIADRLAALELAEQERAARGELTPDLPDAEDEDGGGLGFGVHLSFRSRLTLGLVAAAVLPLAGFGIVAVVAELIPTNVETIGRALLLAIVIAVLIGILLAY